MGELQTTNGHSVLVDEYDLERVTSAGRWFAVKHRHVLYARRCFGAANPILLHHFVFGRPPTGHVVDHLNGNGLDCRKANLRFATHSENCRNKAGALSNSKSGVRGVYRHAQHDFWVAEIRHLGLKKHLGIFRSIDEAAAARKSAEKALWSDADRFRVTHGEGLGDAS